MHLCEVTCIQAWCFTRQDADGRQVMMRPRSQRRVRVRDKVVTDKVVTEASQRRVRVRDRVDGRCGWTRSRGSERKWQSTLASSTLESRHHHVAAHHTKHSPKPSG